ncbi:MTP-1 family protein [Marinicrinis sediminis]|uniref:DUF1861 family protein n=1 Tax=Marinicrinis sediminis TaxID=1652465 RepID=A0ABW5RB76_9BACL
MSTDNREIQSCQALYHQYLQSGNIVKIRNARKLVFRGVGERDVYNISAPFDEAGRLVIAGRVEKRDSEHSEVVFFSQQSDGNWVPIDEAPVLTLQDPFYTRIGGELVIGGVEIFPHPDQADALMWRTVFYKEKDLTSLRLCFTGPDGMKDLRMLELPGGRIAVFTRPQGTKGGRGTIGFTIVDSLDDLSMEQINEAPLLDKQFLAEDWGGANELHLLANGWIGVLGHIARFDEQGDRHYYPMVFALHAETGEYTEMKIIAERSDFLPGATKRSDLKDVVFSGGLVRHANGWADLYAGISDAEAHCITLPDPFMPFEQK